MFWNQSGTGILVTRPSEIGSLAPLRLLETVHSIFRTHIAAFVLAGLLVTPVGEVIGLGIRAAQAQAVSEEVGQAYSLLEQGRVDEAIGVFLQALRRNPDSLPARLGLAIAYRRGGLDQEALLTYERVLEQDPSNPLALKSIGLLGTYRPQWRSRGIEALTTLLDLNPNDNEARTLRALLYGYNFQISESLADYQILLQAPNPTPDVLLGAAQIYVYSGDGVGGLELFERYRQTGEPITGYPAIAYARALRETGRPDLAFRVLEAELNSLPEEEERLWIEARSELSRIYLANGQPQQALSALQPLRSRASALLPLARGLNEIGRQTQTPALSQEAAAFYRLALAQNPNPSPQLVQEVADVLSDLPSEQEFALQLYRQLATQQPNNPILVVQQLALENQLGLISKAELRLRLQTALVALPSNGSTLERLGAALVKIDPPDPQLLWAYEDLLATGVQQPFLNFRIAQIFTELNNPDKARDALATYTATPRGSQDPLSWLLLAEIERQEGDQDTSEQIYQDLLGSLPKDSDLVDAALQGLVGLRLAQNRLEEAIEIYDQLLVRNDDVNGTLELGRTSVVYQQRLISEGDAEALLDEWLDSQGSTVTPPELFSLVGALPADSAREDLYERLIEADPYYMPVQFRRIQVIALRDPDAAQAWVERAIAQDPTNIGAYFLQGEFALGRRDFDVASLAYQTILQQEPDNLQAIAALGDVRFQQREYNEAQGLYEQVLELDPGNPGVRRSLASLMLVRDRPLAALEELKQLQQEQMAAGIVPDPGLADQIQQLEEGLLQRRGFQPPWERF